MTTIEIITILAIHWFADLVCQTDKMAKGKSKNWTDLLTHTAVYTFVSMIWWGILVLPSPNNYFSDLVLPMFSFGIITFVAHTITDYFTSRLNSKLWTEGKVHYFFVSVGFDQVLHYIQLFLTYQLLIA